MRILYRVALKVCPVLAFVFSVIVTATIMYIEEGISPILIFLCVQVYLNWYCIYGISRNAKTTRATSRSGNSVSIPMNDVVNARNDASARSRDGKKFWYCGKCCCYTYRPTQHCEACKKCFHHRDHHCFFIGGCVLRRNMGNFILVCFYTSFACFYSLATIGPHLYENINRRVVQTDAQSFSLYLHFCFPVALARFLILGEDTDLTLVTLFDIVFSVFIMCFSYGAWKLYLCLIGEQKYYPHAASRQNIREIFGSYGLSNIVFPYNGLLITRDIDGKYELKEV